MHFGMSSNIWVCGWQDIMVRAAASPKGSMFHTIENAVTSWIINRFYSYWNCKQPETSTLKAEYDKPFPWTKQARLVQESEPNIRIRTHEDKLPELLWKKNITNSSFEWQASPPLTPPQPPKSAFLSSFGLYLPRFSRKLSNSQKQKRYVHFNSKEHSL